MRFVFFALVASSGLDFTVFVLWQRWVHHGVGWSFSLQMIDVMVATSLRVVLLAIFASMFYRGRRMSLRFPLLWEAVNLLLVLAKSIVFVVEGDPFEKAQLLLGLCTASIGFELVFVAHLRSTAGVLLPRQHVFLPTAVGAMVTLNVAKNPSEIETGGDDDGENGEVEDTCWQADRHLARQNSFVERKRFLSDWNNKVEHLREKWAAKVDEIREKMRHRGWGAADHGEKAPLLLLARMYMQERSAIEELQDLWTRDPKWTEFFLPQYTLFLLYASFVHSSLLEELLLARCESSVQVAHTIYWFLKAFCVEGAGVTPVGVEAIKQMLHEVVRRGERPAQAFCVQGWGGNSQEAAKCMELFDSRHENDSGFPMLQGCFAEAPAFVFELIKIAVELGEVERDQRTGELRKRLRQVQSRFLPSRAIYMPVGRRRHRVYRIAIEESFSFSTKDRAPYLVTLEVMDLRQRQRSPEVSTVEGVGANGDTKKDDERGQSPGSGQKLIQLLTPLSSLRGMKAGIGRTLTTLKGGVSKESTEIDEPADEACPKPLSGSPCVRLALSPSSPSYCNRAARMAALEATPDGFHGEGPNGLRSRTESAASNDVDGDGCTAGDGGNGGHRAEKMSVEGVLKEGRGMQEDDDEELALELVPPSHSSSDLMGMWSRPSKRSEGSTDFLSPLKDSTSCFSPLRDPTGRFSPVEGFPVPAGPPPAASIDARDYTTGEEAAGISMSLNNSGALTGTVKWGDVIPGTAPLQRKPDGLPQTGSDGDFDGRRGVELPLSFVAARKSRACAENGATVMTSYPGSRSVDGGGERADTLLLSRDSAPGSAQRVGYGTIERRTVPPMAAPAVESHVQSQLHSPRRRKLGTWSYAELGESREEILDSVVDVAAAGVITRRAWRRGQEELKIELDGDDLDHLEPGKIEEEMEEEEWGDHKEEEDTDEDEHAGSAPTVIFKERWRQKEARLRRASKLGQAAGSAWRLMPIIVKAGDDLRQEQIASQFFSLAQNILRQSPLGDRAGLRPYEIVATSPDAGMIEAIPDTVSLDALKKNIPHYTSLMEFFRRHFGHPKSEGFQRARTHFVESLAPNCIVTYLLQVKDRHNGNILLDAKGRVMHIDFGFFLANSPGGNLKFESAPFKLTAEFVELMDGPSSICFQSFREVCVQSFMALRQKMALLILFIEASSVGNAHLPCFGGNPKLVVDELRARFVPEVHDSAAVDYVGSLIDRSMKNWSTSWYDLYQNYTVGIAI